MSFRNNYRAFFALLLFVLTVLVIQAQEKAPSLDDAKSATDVTAYLQSELSKLDRSDMKKFQTNAGAILIAAGEKWLTIASGDHEKENAYRMKIGGLAALVRAEAAGSEEKLETFLKELESKEETKKIGSSVRFGLFVERYARNPNGSEGYNKFKSELGDYINNKAVPIDDVIRSSIAAAEAGGAEKKRVIQDLSELIKDAKCTLSDEEKKNALDLLESLFLLEQGNDPKIYGQTIDDKAFNWADLRGKYVLVKFTATWCGPCKGEIPGMLEAYKKYHGKGLEIVSVYIWHRGEGDPVATVKQMVKEEKLPWIIVSEALTEKAGQPKQGEFYGIGGVPTMVLVDKEGKVILTDARGAKLQKKLAEIFMVTNLE